MLFNECFDILVLVCAEPFELRNSKIVKRINSSRNPLSLSPVAIDADPFLVVKDDTLYLFYEEYRYRDKGIIMMTSTDDLFTWSEPKVVLAEDFHLSYPWVFQHDGQWYMMPETSAVHEIRLYKAANNEFEHFDFYKAILQHSAEEIMPTVDFCDSSIVNRDNSYYLFTTVYHGDDKEQLLYCSGSFDSDYEIHPQSPLVVGDKYGRNGGSLIEHEGVLYRFAQDCEGEYGKDIHVFSVKELSRTRYQESLIRNNLLTSSGFSAGHQFNFVYFKGNYIVAIDQKRRFPLLACKVKRFFKK